MYMKTRKLIALFMAAFLLAGCGNADTGSKDEETAATTVTETEAAIQDEKDSEKSTSPENQFALFTTKEQKGVSSTLITFNAEKVGVADICRNASTYTYFDCLDNSGSTLMVGYYEESAEELYEKTRTRYSNKMQEHITLTDIKDVTIGDFTFKRYDVIYKGEIWSQHYMLEMDNGYILHNGSNYNYNESVDIEEMLSYVFVDIEEGDGTSIRPSWGFEKENDGTAVTYTFDSGETFVLDYPEDRVEISATGFVVNVTYLDEKIADNVSLEMYISRKYDSLEPYVAAEVAQGYIEDGLEIKHADVDGLDIAYVCEGGEGSNTVYGLYYVELPDGFSLRGNFRNWYEDYPVSLPDAVGMVLGAEVEMKQTTDAAEGEEEGSGAEYLAEITASYGYSEPSELGATVDTATYSLDGVVYQFPTPINVFLQNGWKIPDVYKQQYGEIANGDSISIALENEAGGIIYNVVVSNPTGADFITLEEGMVVLMQVVQKSNVALELPENLSFESTLDDLKAIPGEGCVENGAYSVYSWWSDEKGCGVSAWYHPEIGIEYFEFIYY